MGKISCALTMNLIQRPSELIARDTFFCQICDGEQRELGRRSKAECVEFEELWAAINAILPRLKRAPGPRIAAMIALKSILTHSPAIDQTYLSSSASGEFCLQSLRSSIRELRIATGYVLYIM